MERFYPAVFSMAIALVSGLLLIGVAQRTNASYEQGTHSGFFWSKWTDDQSGFVNMTLGSGGNYAVSWNYNGNFTCGKGWSSGSNTRVVGYNIGAHTHSGGGVVGYYGWTRNPLIEYYVNERWGNNRPTSSDARGTLSSDGGTYNIYTAIRTNAPSIDGTQTFRQIWSTRTAQAPTGQNRTITFANHRNAWANAGLNLGSDLSPAAILLTEAYGGNSQGYVNATVWDAGSSGGGGGGGGGGGIAGNNRGLINRASGRALDVYNIVNANGTNIAIWDWWGGQGQRWNIASLANNEYSIRSVMSGNRSVDVYNFGTGNGTNIVLWDYAGGTNQRFLFQSVGSGYYRITPVLSTGQCLDAGGTGNGSNVQTWSYWGGNNQQWSIVQ